ncbi:hypothetical protein [Rubripirellula reticaptiva]|uniref:Uncharacterized protein n=1 Tax=Rubripirellula reticaptiva TaxID=2528013 RepID=A0A5C6F7U8_9BACT|nr:hypothetical protein [Rubripirellula reticaptiva]TWU57793.1 hypothetical protein Poly59_07020 [Rubripirellula reticaptiva]
MRRLPLSMCFAFTLTAFALSLPTPIANAVGSTVSDGLKQGDPIGAFRVTKIGGATDDDVEPGDFLCYRCRYGSSPMVMVFARKAGPKSIELATKLDSAIGQHASSKLRGLFTFIGEDAANLKKVATTFAEQSGVVHVPVVIAEDTQNGPIDYRIAEDADITIVIAQDSQVFTSHVFDADAIDVTQVIGDVEKMLQ